MKCYLFKLKRSDCHSVLAKAAQCYGFMEYRTKMFLPDWNNLGCFFFFIVKKNFMIDCNIVQSNSCSFLGKDCNPHPMISGLAMWLWPTRSLCVFTVPLLILSEDRQCQIKAATSLGSGHGAEPATDIMWARNKLFVVVGHWDFEVVFTKHDLACPDR